MHKRQIEEFILDASYGNQHYPILTLPDNVELIEALSGSCCTQKCPYVNYCTYEVPYFEKINLGVNDIIAAFPSDLLITNVYWKYSDLHNQIMQVEAIMEGRWDDVLPEKAVRTIVFAEYQRAGLRIRTTDEGVVTYIGLELEAIKSEDVDFILYLGRTVQACTSSPLFFCEKAVFESTQPMRLDSVEFEKWVRGQVR